MKRKKRKSPNFRTEEEYRAWMVGYRENLRELRARAEQIKAELAAKQQPSS
jgi:hypothetical protein